MKKSNRRGIKICQHCHTENGARSLNCKQCGKGFVIKGELKPDVDINIPVPLREFYNLFSRYAPTEHDQYIAKKFFDGQMVCYRSKCGKYIVRKTSKYQGVDITPNGKYKLYTIGDDGDINQCEGSFHTKRAVVKFVLSTKKRVEQTEKRRNAKKRKK